MYFKLLLFFTKIVVHGFYSIMPIKKKTKVTRKNMNIFSPLVDYKKLSSKFNTIKADTDWHTIKTGSINHWYNIWCPHLTHKTHKKKRSWYPGLTRLYIVIDAVCVPLYPQIVGTDDGFHLYLKSKKKNACTINV